MGNSNRLRRTMEGGAGQLSGASEMALVAPQVQCKWNACDALAGNLRPGSSLECSRKPPRLRYGLPGTSSGRSRKAV